MTFLGLRAAARQVGVPRSNLYRAIQSGRLSATRTDVGGYAIDPAELFRVYPPKAERTRQSATVCVEQDAQPPATDVTEMRVRIATLEGDLQARTAELRTVRELADNLKVDRDAWKGQAERLVLAPPRQDGRRWWPFRRAV